MTITNIGRYAALTLITFGASCASAPLTPQGSGAYARVFGGVGDLNDEDLEFQDTAGGPVEEGEGAFDAGLVTGLAVGYRFDDRLRAELEYTYRSNDVGSFDGPTSNADGGDYASTTVMLNGLYSFDTDWAFEPYVGFGAGYQTEVDIDLDGGSFGGGRSFSGSSAAVQGILGARRRLTDSINVFGEARYFRALNPDMDEEGGVGNVDAEYSHSALLLGVEFAF